MWNMWTSICVVSVTVQIVSRSFRDKNALLTGVNPEQDLI